MKNWKLSLIVVFAFLLGLGINNIAMSEALANYKIGIIDVQKLVEKSGEVRLLKNEQIKAEEELKNWVKVAREDVNKQSTEANKQALTKKYDAELAKKQTENAKNYAKKLSAIDKSISNVIAERSKALGYNIVLAKGVVLYGGDDITESVAKYIK